MVFGLSSSKPLWLTSDHLPSASNLSQSARKKRDAGITQLISQNEQNDLKKTPIILSKNSKWRRHGHKENRDHPPARSSICRSFHRDFPTNSPSLPDQRRSFFFQQ